MTTLTSEEEAFLMEKLSPCIEAIIKQMAQDLKFHPDQSTFDIPLGSLEDSTIDFRGESLSA